MKITRLLAQIPCDENDDYCPAVLLTDTGDVALIGKKPPQGLAESLPQGSGVGPGEALVVVPREVLVAAGWAPPAP